MREERPLLLYFDVDRRSRWRPTRAMGSTSGRVNAEGSDLVKVSFSVGDFLDRAAFAYGDRIGVVDEPSVSGSLGSLTYSQMERRVRGMGRALENMGIGVGDRVAI